MLQRLKQSILDRNKAQPQLEPVSLSRDLPVEKEEQAILLVDDWIPETLTWDADSDRVLGQEKVEQLESEKAAESEKQLEVELEKTWEPEKGQKSELRLLRDVVLENKWALLYLKWKVHQLERGLSPGKGWGFEWGLGLGVGLGILFSLLVFESPGRRWETVSYCTD